MLNHILQSIICYEFERVIGGMQLKKTQMEPPEPMYCMEMTFKLHENSHPVGIIESHLYPSSQLLIFGAMNYIGVYFRESETRDEYGAWQCLSYHDSCWRYDGVGRFIDRYEKRMACLGWHDGLGSNTWHIKREISEKEMVELREITRRKLKR